MMRHEKFTFASDVKSRLIEKRDLQLEIKESVAKKMEEDEEFNQLIQNILAGIDEFLKFNEVKMDGTLRFFQDPEWSKWVNLSLAVYLYIDDFQIRERFCDNLRSYIHPKVEGMRDMKLYFDNIVGQFMVNNIRWD